MGLIGKVQFFQATSTVPFKKVPLPHFATADNPEPHLYVYGMTVLERNRFDKSIMDENGRNDWTRFRTMLLIHAVRDEHGNPYFDEEDEDQLNASFSGPLEKLFEVAIELNNMQAEKKEMEKNLPTQSTNGTGKSRLA